MGRTRRKNPPRVRRTAGNMPNTRTMGRSRLRAFIRDMETCESFREALESHLGLPSSRIRMHQPQLEVIAHQMGNVTQRRKDLVGFGTNTWQNESPHGGWSVEPHDASSSMVVARPGPSVTDTDAFPTFLFRFVHHTDSVEPQAYETYLDVITHEIFFVAFFSRFPYSPGISPMFYSGPLPRPRPARLPVVEIRVSDLDAMGHILQWIYLQDSSRFLKRLLGEGLSASAGRLTEYNYRTRSRAGVPERLHGTLVETTLRIMTNLPRTSAANDILRRRLLQIDAVFQLADELGLDDDTFWRTLAVARRLVFDICAIRHQQTLRSP